MAQPEAKGPEARKPRISGLRFHSIGAPGEEPVFTHVPDQPSDVLDVELPQTRPRAETSENDPSPKFRAFKSRASDGSRNSVTSWRMALFLADIEQKRAMEVAGILPSSQVGELPLRGVIGDGTAQKSVNFVASQSASSARAQVLAVTPREPVPPPPPPEDPDELLAPHVKRAALSSLRPVARLMQGDQVLESARRDLLQSRTDLMLARISKVSNPEPYVPPPAAKAVSAPDPEVQAELKKIKQALRSMFGVVVDNADLVKSDAELQLEGALHVRLKDIFDHASEFTDNELAMGQFVQLCYNAGLQKLMDRRELPAVFNKYCRTPLNALPGTRSCLGWPEFNRAVCDLSERLDLPLWKIMRLMSGAPDPDHIPS
mmetsp:Transcript_24003/g.58267  ORF Transcript_24003/g.58267 Transcript_24003/m.58267 type:complete len:374 (+) Transcript_24003:24-1145(+)